jgi:site-specific DNA recombinase
MSGAPFGYRYVSVREGGGQARFEPVAEQARVVQQIFSWIGRDRCSLAEVCRRLHAGGMPSATGKTIWSREAVWHVLQNPAYMGQAAYGKTHMTPRGKKSRLRAARGHPTLPRRSNAPKPTNPKEWVLVAVPALVDVALFRAAHAQLEENRSRARQGRRRPGYLLQGLCSCSKCGYAYYGKTLRQLGAGGQMRDFLYYRCSGSDGYRFGGERMCSNAQIQGNLLDMTIWSEISKLLIDPRRVELEHQDRTKNAALLDNLETLRSHKAKLEHAVVRLIDSFAEGLIEKDQFTSRMARTKSRIADLDTRIDAYAGDLNRRDHLRLAANRIRDLAATVGPELERADWQRKREIIRTVVQRIDIDTDVMKIIFRVNPNTRTSDSDGIAIGVPRPSKRFRYSG